MVVFLKSDRVFSFNYKIQIFMIFNLGLMVGVLISSIQLIWLSFNANLIILLQMGKEGLSI
jgi:hypothetical protein